MLVFSNLEKITSGKIVQLHRELPVEHLLTDSRKLIIAPGSVFFAISGLRHDGHTFIEELFSKGIRQFVVESIEAVPEQIITNCNILQTKNSLDALQAVAIKHRLQFDIPVIGITGSNGKTIIKEWLYELLSSELNLVKSPKSYNSQLGVPLSVWQMNQAHEMAIFEAGISEKGKMESLQQIIQPTIGIFTNIGAAHDEGFSSRNEKINEKLKLFTNCKVICYCKDHSPVHQQMLKFGKQVTLFNWSMNEEANVIVREKIREENYTRLTLEFEKKIFHFDVPFTDQASLENVMHCITYLLYENFNHSFIQKQVNRLSHVSMRLELKHGINQSYLIDDSYNNDLAGLQVALDFLEQQKQRKKKTLILSDILQSGLPSRELYQQVSGLLKDKHVDRLIGIGSELTAHQDLFEPSSIFFSDTDVFLEYYNKISFDKEIVLVKGARVFEFEKIVQKLQQKIHGTVLEINLDALINNLNYYKSKLQPETKIMAMVKAFAYGSGIIEIAHLLQYHRVDYLAVAYADEGVMLRENGITLPVMIMNPSIDSFDKIVDYNLEPEIYSLRSLKALTDYLDLHHKEVKIHIKIDTGMHRLGFDKEDISELIDVLNQYPLIKVVSIFSHLAGADECTFDAYTRNQIADFEHMADQVIQKSDASPLKHILNSAGIIRFPEFQFDMVRLGIGLYGIDASEQEQAHLEPIGTLKTRISQIKQLRADQTIGYSRKGIINRYSRIATIGIGYADGFTRKFGNGNGMVMVNGKKVPVVGNVCMDMTMIDVTGIDAEEGDEVIIFGKGLPVHELAARIDTIPYEILTSISDRVKRVFFTG